MRIGFYTPHIVNWESGAANARMPMLEELVRRGHHLVLMRKKHQREKPDSLPGLPDGSFTQLNLENEWLGGAIDTEQVEGLSKTDSWMQYNLQHAPQGAFPWPDVDVVLMEPFAVFPANQLFQMAMIMTYAPETKIVMYDMDLGHGSMILGRLQKLMPDLYQHCRESIVAVSMHDSDEVYEGLRIRRVYLPYGAWLQDQIHVPYGDPEVDLVFVGRDLNRRPRMKELVLRPSTMGITVRVHGKYDDDLKNEYPVVEWREEVPPRALAATIWRGLCTVVVLQSKQAKVGFYPVRFVDGALSGALQLVDANIKGGRKHGLVTVKNAEDVVKQIEQHRRRTNPSRRRIAAKQLEIFANAHVGLYVDRIEEVLHGRTP